jgi:hypothetical protein
MQKHYENLDDYDDHSRHPLMDKVICCVRMTIIFLCCMAVLLVVCGLLEAM